MVTNILRDDTVFLLEYDVLRHPCLINFHSILPISLTQRPPLWSSGQSSWLQIQSYQTLREVVGLKRGLLSLVSTIEELLERKSSGSGLENREYGRG
jgi:hypothetical protein